MTNINRRKLEQFIKMSEPKLEQGDQGVLVFILSA